MRTRFSHLCCLTLCCLMISTAHAQDAATETATAPKDIVDTAVESGKFQTLVKLINASGLAAKLKAKGPYTVFAPSEKAFKKVAESDLKALLLPENKTKLQSLLKSHVLPGKLMAADVVKLTKSKTAQGTEVVIKASGETVTVNGSKIVKTDIECVNGVIHVVDTVIMPQSDDRSGRTASESSRTPSEPGSGG